MKIGWVLGWAIPQAWFAGLVRESFPGGEHGFVAPGPDALDRLESLSGLDWVVGYSLGSLLLLGEAARARRLGRVALLAPIFGFPQEERLGGKVTRAELRLMDRRLRQNPSQAIEGFYSSAGLAHSPAAAGAAEGPELSPGRLEWGLERLRMLRVDPPMPEPWVGWCGTHDTLLDAAGLHGLDPKIIPLANATHHPRALIGAFAGFVRETADRTSLQ